VGNAVTGGTNDALNAVSKEYRNAQGQVVDGLGNFPVKSPKLPLGGGVDLEFAPVLTPIAVKIQPSQWASANAMNMQLNLSFLGIRPYQVQFGCLGFPNGWTAAPTFTFNGGCHNPWYLMANADMVASVAKEVANQAGRQLEGMSEQILAVLTSAAKQADNPRSVPPMVLDLPINEFLGWCCSLGFPSSKTAESPDAGKPPKKDGTKEPTKPGEDPGGHSGSGGPRNSGSGIVIIRYRLTLPEV
jgi:hypothetical protein